jgi:hypothetical protein
MTGSNLWTDGNALAEPFHGVFCVDVTTAIGRCTACGRTGPMAEARLFDHAPGVVARCRVCDQVLLRLVRGPGRAWLDLGGLTYLQLPYRTRPEPSEPSIRASGCALHGQPHHSARRHALAVAGVHTESLWLLLVGIDVTRWEKAASSSIRTPYPDVNAL